MCLNFVMSEPYEFFFNAESFPNYSISLVVKVFLLLY